jgi:hypothetical protein
VFHRLAFCTDDVARRTTTYGEIPFNAQTHEEEKEKRWQ